THQLLLSTTSPSTTTKSNNLTGDNTQESGGIPVLNTYIAPIGNTTTSSLNSATVLSNNTWGFALSSNTRGIESNNFDSDYSTTTNDSKFTTVPVNGSEVLLTQDTEPISNTTIYYGVKADRDIPAGNYSNTVLYTALAEQPSEIRVSPSTINLSDPYQTLTIYTSISTTDTDLGTATVAFKNSSGDIETDTCTNVSLHTDSNNYLYATCTSPTLLVGNYDVVLTLNKYGRVLEGNNDITYEGTSPMQQITTMQQMTTNICQNSPIGTTMRLRDTRGMGNAGSNTTGTYGVIRAKDGNCWMTDNLNLYNKTIAAADSDFTSPTSYTIPASITATNQWNSNIYNAKRVEVAHGLGNEATQDQSYWGEVFYNWTVAVAKETAAGVTTAPNTSICPKGWTLPTNGGVGVNKSWAKLLDAYSITTGTQLLANTYLGFSLYYGFWNWDNASEYGQGIYGLFWSGTPSSETSAYYLGYISGAVNPQDNYDKGRGLIIRCVAR
ncbi:hypothetical protein IKG54_01105, partial [Candidatus Saccharibacteria bacterium]|nr:hypothetical protein [Candidatus Saccharibacteria bacterium]